VRPGAKVKLKEWPTLVKEVCKSKKQYHKLLEAHVEELSELQRLHYASNRYAILLIFQAMDAAGKDGAIRHVMSGVNPQGCQVFSFKQPSAEDLEHDFLWRTTRCLRERGRITAPSLPAFQQGVSMTRKRGTCVWSESRRANSRPRSLMSWQIASRSADHSSARAGTWPRRLASPRRARSRPTSSCIRSPRLMRF